MIASAVGSIFNSLRLNCSIFASCQDAGSGTKRMKISANAAGTIVT